MSERDSFKKLAFVGAACVGKTTLLHELKDRYPNNSHVGFVDEVGRRFFQENPIPDSEVFSFGIQRRIQERIINEEQRVQSRNHEIIFCDRSVIDSPVHLRAHGDIDGAQRLTERASAWIPTYSSFLLLDPADVPFQNDTVRRESAETRQNIHDTFISYFDEYQIPYKLLGGTLAERVSKVQEIVSLK